MASKKDRRLILLESANAYVNKTYGERSSGSAAVELVEVGLWASTGSLALDRAIGGGWLPGGIPMGPRTGRMVHIFGDPSLGKSALLDWIVYYVVMELGGMALISELEGARTPTWAKMMGLDLRYVSIQKPKNIDLLFDEGLDWIMDIRKKDWDIPLLWGIDSMAITEAAKTYGKHMSDDNSYMRGGGKSEAWGVGLAKASPICNTSQTTLVLLNQIRESMPVPGQKGPAPKKPTGGWPARFAASIEIQLTRSRLGRVVSSGRVIGRWMHANIVKSRVRPPHCECDFLINFYTGLSKWAGVFESLESEKKVHIKRNKKGEPASNEFTIIKTGEVLPVSDFVQWCENEKVLWTPPPLGAYAPLASSEEEKEETTDEPETKENEETEPPQET